MRVIIKNLQKKIPVNPKRIQRIVLNTLSLEGVEKSGEITICLVDDERIKELNLMYRDSPYATDCLSFDNSLMQKNEILADIVISTDAAYKNSRIFKTSPRYELYLYVVHGLLHLLGYDDKSTRQKRIMDKTTQAILKQNVHL